MTPREPTVVGVGSGSYMPATILLIEERREGKREREPSIAAESCI